MERAAEREHDVVRDVDDVRDRPHAGVPQARLEPRRRLAERDVAEDAADEAEAALRVLDPDPDRLVAVALRILARHRQQLAAEQRRDLARDAVDGEQVGAVAGRVELEHLVDERQRLGERRPGLERVVEDDDPGVVGAEVELVLGEDHPLGDLRRAACAARASARSGSVAPGSATATFAPGAEVPGAADDRVRPVLPHVDRRELQPVGVGMLLRLEHVADAEEPEVAGHADAVRRRSTSAVEIESASAISCAPASTRTYSRSQLSGTLIGTA